MINMRDYCYIPGSLQKLLRVCSELSNTAEELRDASMSWHDQFRDSLIGSTKSIQHSIYYF